MERAEERKKGSQVLIAERFMAKVRRTDSCWIWSAAKYWSGYGAFRYFNRIIPAHRASYQIHTGKIPDGFVVMHRCDNKSCVNPAHLKIGTQMENIRDKMTKGRQLRGEKHGRALLEEKDVRQIHSLRRKNMTMEKIGSIFGIGSSHVSQILSRRMWGHVG